VEGALDDVGLMEGPDAIRDYYRQWEETFEDIRVEVEELIDARDQVVAIVRGIGPMKDSDAEVDIRYAIVFTTRDGKIAQGREYFTREQALDAAGLSESVMSEENVGPAKTSRSPTALRAPLP
jgi:ketosteroid isomerase-like protein